MNIFISILHKGKVGQERKDLSRSEDWNRLPFRPMEKPVLSSRETPKGPDANLRCLWRRAGRAHRHRTRHAVRICLCSTLQSLLGGGASIFLTIVLKICAKN